MANDINFKNREIVITKALRLEKASSMLVKHLIGISVRKKTRALDNKSSTLSLKSRMDLLLDTNIIDKQTYKYIGFVLSIRNQFAHNYECNNFEDLSQYIDGINKHLIDCSDEETIEFEDKLKSGFIAMADAVIFTLTMKLGSVIIELDAALTELNDQLVENLVQILRFKGIHDESELHLFRQESLRIASDVSQTQERNEQLESLMSAYVKKCS